MDDTVNTVVNTDRFRWPDSPPFPTSDWFQVTGNELGLRSDQIRFAATLIAMGGLDGTSRDNSLAASIAGMDLDKGQAHRLARSVKVRRLIDAAFEIKTGKRKTLTDDQIDQRIDQMCMSPSDRDAATGIRLRDERKAARSGGELSLDEAFEAADKAAPDYGPQFIVEAYFNAHTSLPWSCDPFVRLARRLATAFPDRWRHFQEKLPAHRPHFSGVGIERL